MTTDKLRYTRFPVNTGSGKMPAAGFGSLFQDVTLTTQAVRDALAVGFRHIDCAERYRTEGQVGVAFREAFDSAKVRREDLFVTTKLWNTNHRPERVKPACEASLQRLQLDYLDCYLIHTPFAFQPGDDFTPRDEQGEVIYDKGVTLIETWRAMESLVDEGKCRAIGLSDITVEGVQEVFEEARIKPAVVQVECHPYLPEWELLEFCQKHGIILLAFAALGHNREPKVLEDAVIKSIAERLEKTPAQVALAWSVQRGVAFLTTSATLSHIKENFDIDTLPPWAMQEMNEKVTTRQRLNTVIATGVPGFFGDQ